VSKNRGVNFRMDFVFTDVKRMPDGSVRFRSVPDPRRYQRELHEGRWRLVDRFSKLVFDEESALRQVAEFMQGMPIGYEPSGIDDQDAWVLGRAEAIAVLLDGEGHPSAPASRSHDELLAGVGTDRAFAIATVVVRNAMALAAASAEHPARVNATLGHELALAADLHRGNLWSAAASSYSFFFAVPSLITKVDLALAFATTARDLVRVVGQVLRARMLPEVAVGIGVEAGVALPHVSGLNEHHTEVDLAGVVVAASHELAQIAEPDDVLVGPWGAQLAHTTWQSMLTPLNPQPALSLLDGSRQRGEIYRLAPDARGA
jgi:hypothetical protein